MFVDKRKRKGRISYALLGVAWKLFDLHTRNNCYGTDKRLYEAEIHMIMHIRDNPGLHISALAEKIGVTKGAVSQTVIKLERKGMVVKEREPHNQSKTLLRLTPQGEIAYAGHKELHREFDREVDKLLAGASPGQVEFLRNFLADLDAFVDKVSQ